MCASMTGIASMPRILEERTACKSPCGTHLECTEWWRWDSACKLCWYWKLSPLCQEPCLMSRSGRERIECHYRWPGEIKWTHILHALTLITPGKSTSTILWSPGPLTFRDMVYGGGEINICGDKYPENSCSFRYLLQKSYFLLTPK